MIINPRVHNNLDSSTIITLSPSSTPKLTLMSSSSLLATLFNFLPTDEKFRSRSSPNSGSAELSRYFFLFSLFRVAVGGGGAVEGPAAG